MIKFCNKLKGVRVPRIAAAALTMFAMCAGPQMMALDEAIERTDEEKALFQMLEDGHYSILPVPVNHDGVQYIYEVSREYYQQFSYTWKEDDEDDKTSHTSLLTDKATHPNQIIALLAEVYRNPLIPGFRRDRYANK